MQAEKIGETRHDCEQKREKPAQGTCYQHQGQTVTNPKPHLSCLQSIAHPASRIMKRKTITYWTASVFVTLVLGISGSMAILHADVLMKALAHLGYPPYFSNVLAIGKIIGLAVFLAPRMPRLKEWAYAGFSITILSACYSHYSSGDGWLTLEPLVTFAALMVSYVTRPESRRPQS